MASISMRRGVLRSAFTKVYNCLLPMISASDVDLVEVSCRFKLLESKYLDLVEYNKKYHNELFESSSADFENVLLADMECCDDYELKYQTIKCRVESLMLPAPTVVSSEHSSNAEKKSRVKLPKLKLRPYNGDISQWIAFWSQFSCIDQDESLSKEEKFQYLIQATSPESRARGLIDSFPPSAENYSKAVEALKERFGRHDLLIEHYVRVLLQLVVSKQRMKLCELYDSLEMQMRALETLGIVSEQYAALLFPLIESCIPADILKVWQRTNTNHGASLKLQMDALMDFLRREVETEERVTMAVDGAFQSGRSSQNWPNHDFTAADMANLSVKHYCIFCEGRHGASDCQAAASMTWEEKKAVMEKMRACFGCAKLNHVARFCHAVCVCGGRHINLLCPRREKQEARGTITKTSRPDERDAREASLLAVDHNLSMSDCSEVFLQTFAAVLYNGDKQCKVRVLVDSGSQRSYILKKLAQEMKYNPTGEESLVHSLFGGGSGGMVKHLAYKIRLRSMSNDFACNFTALDQGNIADFVPKVTPGRDVQKELTEMKIHLIEDLAGPIDILIGADVAGKIWSGSPKVLSSGVVAINTLFGWTLMGTNKKKHSTVNTGLAMTYTMTSIQSGDGFNLRGWEYAQDGTPVEQNFGRNRDRASHLYCRVSSDCDQRVPRLFNFELRQGSRELKRLPTLKVKMRMTRHGSLREA